MPFEQVRIMNVPFRNQITTTRRQLCWLFSSLFLLPSSFFGQATIYGYLSTSTGLAPAGTQVQFNLTAAMNDFPIFEYRQTFSATVTTNGYFVVTNVLPGYYNVTIGPNIDTVPIAVPNNTNAYNFLNLQNTVLSNLPANGYLLANGSGSELTNISLGSINPGSTTPGYIVSNANGTLVLALSSTEGIPMVANGPFSIPPSSYNIAAWGDSLTYGDEDGTGVTYPGVLSLDLNGRPVFNAGVSGQTSTQIAARETASTGTLNWTTIIWAGRNDFATLTPCTTDISNMVAALGTNTNYVVLSVLNAQGEGIGTTAYTEIANLNASLSNSWYPSGHYLDVRHALVTNYNPNLPQDVIDFNDDIPPNSLAYAGQVHLNAAGYTLLAGWVAKFITNNLDPHPVVTNLLTTAFWQQMLASPFAIGGISPSAGTFTELTIETNATLPSGAFTFNAGFNANKVPLPFLVDGGAATENTYLGFNAGGLTGAGSYNTAFGYGALAAQTTGNENTAVGTLALQMNTGTGNTAVGKFALQANTNGSYNAATGDSALTANLSGSFNAALGYFALLSNTNGSNNTGLGYSTLKYNLNGLNNTAVGSTALYSNSVGSANTGMGYFAMAANTTGSNNTAVGNTALQGNTNGQGNTALGSGALTANQYGNYNTAVGGLCMNSNQWGVNNMAIGYFSLYSSTNGSYNVAVGFGSMQNSLSSSNCLAVGCNSMFSATNSTNGIALGENAMYSSKTGLNSIAMGINALYTATNTTDCLAEGYDAMFSALNPSSDVALGHQALFSTVNGLGCTAIGFKALFNTLSNYNTALGWQAGINNVLGSNCVYVANGGSANDTNVARYGSNQTVSYISGQINGSSNLVLNDLPGTNFLFGPQGGTNNTPSTSGVAFLLGTNSSVNASNVVATNITLNGTYSGTSSNGYFYQGPYHFWYYTNLYATNINSAAIQICPTFAGTNVLVELTTCLAYCPTNSANAVFAASYAFEPLVGANTTHTSTTLPVTFSSQYAAASITKSGSIAAGVYPAFTSTDTTNYWKISAWTEVWGCP
jgi:lysophospholipase L1-like esterase